MNLQLKTAKDTIKYLRTKGCRFLFNAYDDNDSYQCSSSTYTSYMRKNNLWVSFSCISENKLPIVIVPKTKDEEFMYNEMITRLKQYPLAKVFVEDYLWAEDLLNDYERNGFKFQYATGVTKNDTKEWCLFYKKPNTQEKQPYDNVGNYATPHECCVNTMEYLEETMHKQDK